MQNDGSFKVRIRQGSATYDLSVKKGENLLYALQKNGVPVPSPCAGNGRCKKCAVRIKGQSEEILLSCRTTVTSDLEGELLFGSEGDIVSVTAESSDNASNISGITAIAADLGTTTIALALIDRESGRVIDTVSTVNPQRRFGSDVISRVEQASSGGAHELKKLAAKGLKEGMELLINRNPEAAKKLDSAAVSGNTCMLNLLTGKDVTGLMSYPFTAPVPSLEKCSLKELISVDLPDIPLFILPGKSGFIGADAVSGLLSLGFNDNEKVNALIDIGTNAEMAVGNRDKILTASAAAGPAFEGGNLKFGTAGIPGAISGVKITGKRAEIRTIGNVMPPVGICGTGALEALSELFTSGLMDETGLLTEEFFDEGFPLFSSGDERSIVLSEDDIRELQLAKAAIRAGFELLLKGFGISADNIDKLYLSGGFGYFLDPVKAGNIGLIPKDLVSRTVNAGNTSLAGTIRFLKEGQEAEEKLEALLQKTEELILSADSEFNDRFLEEMGF